MRQFTLICLLFSCLAVNAQTNDTAPVKPVDTEETADAATIEKKPVFPGGIPAFMQYISKNFQQPDVDGLVGRVLVTFVIEKDGTVGEVKIIKDLGYGTAEEAIRVVSSSPKWTPGEQSGKKVRVKYSLPIVINTGG